MLTRRKRKTRPTVSAHCTVMTVWTEIDEHVVRWVAEERPAGTFSSQVTLTIRPDELFEPISSATARQVDDALQRLVDYGLIATAAPRHETSAYAVYYGLRVTALGHRLFGDWPDLEQVSELDALRLALEVIAEGAPPNERRILRRATGVVGEIGLAIVQRSVATAAGEVAGDL
jgi:hypothetical protein